jgi:hypothetical protein
MPRHAEIITVDCEGENPLPLATVDDVAARLGRPIAESERPRINAFLTDATGLVANFCGQDFEHHQDESFGLTPVVAQQLLVPPRYLPNLVITVVAFDGGEPLTDWSRSGQYLVRDAGWCHGQVVTVTGTWGYASPPPAVVAVVCGEVIRWLALSPGIAAERVGEVEVTYGSPSTGQFLSPAARSALSRYRRQIASVSFVRTEG